MALTKFSDIFIPEVAAANAIEAFAQNMEIMAGLGILGPLPPSVRQKMAAGGEFVTLPRYTHTSGIVTRRDLTANTAVTASKLSTKEEHAVLLRRKALMAYDDSAIVASSASAAELSAEKGRQIGNAMFAEAKISAYRVAIAAIQAIDTPTANIHVESRLAKATTTLTYQALNDARFRMGDKLGILNTVIMRSEQWKSLQDDVLSTANVNFTDVLSMLVSEGTVPSLRLRVILDDDLPFTAATSLGGGTLVASQYNALLFGPDAMYLDFQRQVEFNFQREILNENIEQYVRADMDFLTHLRGIGWKVASGANPADAAVSTVSNYEEIYSDHRNLPAVLLITE